MFIKASELINRVTIAAKDANSRVRWVTLDPMYHSTLVRTAIAATKANGPSQSIASIKEALFILILDILNGKQKQFFFRQLEQERPPKGDGRSSTQPNQKGSQATIGKTNIPPPPPPLCPPPLANKDSTILTPPGIPPMTAAVVINKNPPLKNSPPLAPLQAHPPLQALPDSESLSEDAEISEIEAQLMKDLEEFTRLDAIVSSSKQVPKDIGTTSQKKDNNAAAVPAPSRPTTRQALKGHLKHTPRLDRI